MHLAHGECRSKQQDAVAAQAAQGMAEVEWHGGRGRGRPKEEGGAWAGTGEGAQVAVIAMAN